MTTSLDALLENNPVQAMPLGPEGFQPIGNGASLYRSTSMRAYRVDDEEIYHYTELPVSDLFNLLGMRDENGNRMWYDEAELLGLESPNYALAIQKKAGEWENGLTFDIGKVHDYGAAMRDVPLEYEEVRKCYTRLQERGRVREYSTTTLADEYGPEPVEANANYDYEKREPQVGRAELDANMNDLIEVVKTVAAEQIRQRGDIDRILGALERRDDD